MMTTGEPADLPHAALLCCCRCPSVAGSWRYWSASRPVRDAPVRMSRCSAALLLSPAHSQRSTTAACQPHDQHAMRSSVCSAAAVAAAPHVADQLQLQMSPQTCAWRAYACMHRCSAPLLSLPTSVRVSGSQLCPAVITAHMQLTDCLVHVEPPVARLSRVSCCSALPPVAPRGKLQSNYCAATRPGSAALVHVSLLCRAVLSLLTCR